MSDDDDKKLRMSFDPSTLEHLGVKMYSSLPNALAELIANAYDADATCVRINLHDDGANKSIEVIDDGVGMTFDEINDKFLRIGRNRRAEEDTYSPSGNRKATGKKGLGKLALFGLAQRIKIETRQKRMDEKIIFELDWNKIMSSEKPEYNPTSKLKPCDPSKQGTKITLLDLKRSSPFDKKELAVSISKLFVFFDNKKFKCCLTLNNDEPMAVNQKLKYESVDEQFPWKFPEFSMSIDDNFEYKNRISGKIISTRKPLKPNLRGITLYANGRLVNAPEFFGRSESSHVYSYLTGWLEVDYIDNLEEDVISTNRQSLNWENEEMKKLRNFLFKILQKIVKEWREKWQKAKEEKISKDTGINIEIWMGETPESIRKILRRILRLVIEDGGIDPILTEKIVNNIYGLVPGYPYYHWRNLHPKVKEISREYYQKEDYYTAFSESVKCYIDEIMRITGSQSPPFNLMKEVFILPDAHQCSECNRPFKPIKKVSGTQPILDVTAKYVQSGKSFKQATLDGIQKGQGLLSQGVVAGGRNTMAHEEFRNLKQTDLFTEDDCLDALSILSHLFRRLEDAQ